MRYVVKVWDTQYSDGALSSTFLADVDSSKKLKELIYLEGEELINRNPDARNWYWDRACDLAASEYNDGENDEWWYYSIVNKGTAWKYHRIADDAPNPYREGYDVCISYDDFVADYGVEEHEKRNIRTVREIRICKKHS